MEIKISIVKNTITRFCIADIPVGRIIIIAIKDKIKNFGILLMELVNQFLFLEPKKSKHPEAISQKRFVIMKYAAG